MSDIDDKLREIIDDPIVTRFDKNDSDKAIRLIKQIFAEESYVKQGRHELINERLREKVISGEIMTGQEWYDRFEKELSQAPAKFNQLMEGTVAVKEVRMAAKRASGIGDEK